MVMLPVYQFRHFLEKINDEALYHYPVYGVLLYTHSNGLQQAIHEYVTSRWDRLDRMTGPSFLVMAVEHVEGSPGIECFSPEEVYEIGRHLGVQQRQLPCLVLFTDPRSRNDSLILELKEFLPAASETHDEDITDLFATLSSLVDLSVPEPDARRLRRLDRAINREWPSTSRLAEIVSQGGALATSAVAAAATIAQSSEQILAIIRRVSGAAG